MANIARGVHKRQSQSVDGLLISIPASDENVTRVLCCNEASAHRFPGLQPLLLQAHIRWHGIRPLNWGGSTRFDDDRRLEWDAYDGGAAMYLIAIVNGAPAGVLRLLPLWGPSGSMLRDVFSGAPGADPRKNLLHPAITLPICRSAAEFSRLVVLPSLGQPARAYCVDLLTDAFHQLCLQPFAFTGSKRPIKRVFGVCYPRLWDAFRRRGCDVRALGPVKEVSDPGEAPALVNAGVIAISPAALLRIRERTGVEARLEYGRDADTRDRADSTAVTVAAAMDVNGAAVFDLQTGRGCCFFSAAPVSMATAGVGP